MAIIGRTRVSPKDKDTTLRDTAMNEVKVDRFYIDQGVSGTLASCTELDRALDRHARADAFAVWKLDRLGRNTKKVLKVIEELIDRGVTAKSLTEQIDLSAEPMGTAMLTILAAFAEPERATMIERTRAGLDAARSQGRVGGRPSGVDAKKLTTIERLPASGEHSRAEVASMAGTSHATLHRVILSL